MNAFSMLENSNMQVIQVVENIKENDWDVPGVAGGLTVKEMVAHLGAYERLILDALRTFSGQPASPELLRWANNPEQFNLSELEAQRYATAQQVEQDFQELQVEATSRLKLLPEEQVQQHGTLPWYRPEASLEDFLTLMTQHLERHCEQIKAFRRNYTDTPR